ncbi:bifunctional diaminohydroxyphosphoribosylaminopyrimidine deaminase/5-amino-6-(5-phosphoribosylamino)uracil reductase RibD [Methylocapsa sp. S129]|uniref:bifunctional diaminohydroxyphosphoribosylaminopyrimidine deaminase/5-amino-6-(5-phosphoribosylamino)uracil reductase RibD n=1 Tax=Methylocapsa sp. S129 TaxID=1641869 RepID=UPI001FEF6329|nr:bifunctional diaminohydroxyphosphoribosylaminopyrimidine deaminase/5-amino-6-(5-phosphoribosylamino)uracil reductase RibD [Methylocapsa sp. S129]
MTAAHSAPDAVMAEDERFMAAALALGRRNLGVCAPSPSVGALIVRDGVLVGRGVTSKGGRPHAERNAIDQAGPAAAGATLYVTLEPCFHQGRGPPCAQAVAAAGIARVVSAIEDPDERVAGRGHALLREAGVEVVVGIGARAARRDHCGHILRVTQGRPMVTLKLARTADGYAAGDEHDPRLAITGEAANLRVQVMRAMHDAIMVGAGTALGDDPLLTVRLPGAEAFRPLRVVLDARLRLSPRSRLGATARDFPTLAIATDAAPAERAAALEAVGVSVERVAADREGHVDLGAALRALGRRGVTRVFSEGGPGVGSALIAQGLADEVILFTAQKPLGRTGLPALDRFALSALDDRACYAEAEIAHFGSDEMRDFQRLERLE